MSGYPVLKGILQSSTNYTWNTADSLGRGATAVVYLGREKGTGHVVAVKVFHEHLRIGQGGEELRELELLRRLNHENIISLFAIEQEMQTKRIVLVMEYCEGGSLYHMLDQAQYQYGLPEQQFLLVLFHVAAGMQYLRKSGVIHRDIKPGNIMRYLTEDGSSIYKLTDFGAARDLNEDENFTSLYGTEEYLHPGMYQRAVLRQPTGQQFDAKVDLWSLGVTFYHVATGQLPFQPYGGRNNKETMYRIISQKESGVISGQQHFEGGPILWGRELPATCLLSSGVRQVITPVLAGLMEPNPASMLTYEAFFKSVKRLQAQTKLFIFNYVHASMNTLFIDPTCTLSGLQDAIASLTDQPASQQLLLVGGQVLEDIVDPLAPISKFPMHIKSCTVYLFPRELTMTEAPPLPQREIPPFPEFLNIIDVDKDARLALNCLARGHLIKHHTEKVAQQQRCLVEGHLFLRMYIEGRLRAAGEALQLMQTQIAESKKRFDMFYQFVNSITLMLTPLGSQAGCYFRDILTDETLRKVHVKAEERAEEIQRYRRGLQEKMEEARPHSTQWFEMCEKSACTSKVEHHLTVITNIQNRFRRDKTVKSQMTAHDENIHRFERQKLQEHCMRMLSILTGHCVPSLDRLHKQAFGFTGLLVKALARIIKVEKNNESVINCQQLLSSRLDKIESKCQEEVRHVQEKHRARLVQQQELDEGLGTSVATGARPEGVSFKAPGGESVEPMSFKDDLQSLRAESEELLNLFMGNLDIMKKLEEESNQMMSCGSLSRLLQENKLT
ncbi:serine/threonine-protein kinase TBK1-like [Littorina saxatilis]|uniref:Protein kinase domain-containing protein n=1 Tax=Littorina saxatilis TaxID=31220 RepID=A0AAN9GAM1_9CAEN